MLQPQTKNVELSIKNFSIEKKMNSTEKNIFDASSAQGEKISMPLKRAVFYKNNRRENPRIKIIIRNQLLYIFRRLFYYN